MEQFLLTKKLTPSAEWLLGKVKGADTPQGVKYVAMDKSGAVYAYEGDEPVIEERIEQWYVSDDNLYAMTLILSIPQRETPKSINWQEALIDLEYI